jgi:peptidoglycan/xylan/chitin deacetylase (PgdA/CDA1 family)
MEGTDNSAMRCDDRILHLLFPSVLFTTTTAGIHLTFDDGPHPIATPAVLNILRKRNIQATFFFLGQNVQQYPDIARQVASEGHHIGNHSYTHANLFFKDEPFIRKEIIQTEEIFESILNKRAHYFRPPFGYFNLTILDVVKEIGSTCVLWDIDSKDYRLTRQLDIERRVLPHATNGSIFLFHDNDATSQKLHTYLPILLDILLGKGFVFKLLEP